MEVVQVVQVKKSSKMLKSLRSAEITTKQLNCISVSLQITSKILKHYPKYGREQYKLLRIKSKIDFKRLLGLYRKGCKILERLQKQQRSMRHLDSSKKQLFVTCRPSNSLNQSNVLSKSTTQIFSNESCNASTKKNSNLIRTIRILQR